MARMRNSMAKLTLRFSADRAVREYTERYYLPGAEAHRKRAADNGATGRRLVEWRRSIESHWGGIRLGEVRKETVGGRHILEAQVYLQELDPAAVSIEIYAEAGADGTAVRQEMERVRELAGDSGAFAYSGSVPSARPLSDYTVRVIPRFGDAAVPLESARILWQK